MKKGHVDDEKYQQLVWMYHEKQQKLKAIQKKFESIKSEFEEEMLSLFNGNTVDKTKLRVKMVERVTIDWNPDRLEKKLPKQIAKKVIRKQYRVNDMDGLIKYLKTCNVDPSVFKKYITVDKTVDQNEVDRLGDIGQISVQAVSGCYVVKCQKPYFTISVKKDNDDEE